MRDDQYLHYLAILKMGLNEPSYDYLYQLCHAHLHTFAFENISKLVLTASGEDWIPSIEQFIENYSLHHFGGTCYTLNTSFMQLLLKIGFNCSPVKVGKDHLAIIVSLNESNFYVDVGSAAPIFKPVNLDLIEPSNRMFGSDKIQIIQTESGYEYMRWKDNQKREMNWTFHLNGNIQVEEFKPIYRESIQAEASFMNILRCQIWQNNRERSLSLLNNAFTIENNDGARTTTYLSSVSEIEKVLDKEFKLKSMPIRAAIEILEKRGVNVFVKE
ncbi:arylamine N-acetyltransferase [Alkalicoccobacillus gibsonii]|uniref:Arylamine N-acetyltransferase n=1 Tax=Alkalicoccobacillus gibsonii TaxID=79881 RepID=A0ABU9VDP0_9BACI